MKLICLIPARTNSKRLKNKNFLNFNGKSLLEWSLILSKKVKNFDRIVFSTDNLKIFKLRKKYPDIVFLKRPKKIAKDDTPMSSVIKHTINYLKKKGENYDALVVSDKSSSLNMNGRKIYRMAIDNLPYAIEQCLMKNELNIQDVDRWYFHQGSQFVLDSICKSMGLRKEIVPDNIRTIGNTTSSSIPILMKDDDKNLRLSKIVGLVGFGVGLSWGCAFMEIGDFNDL